MKVQISNLLIMMKQYHYYDNCYMIHHITKRFPLGCARAMLIWVYMFCSRFGGLTVP